MRWLGPGVLANVGDQTEVTGFIGPTIGITISGGWTGTILWQGRPRQSSLQGGSSPSSPVPFQTLRTFAPTDFTANQPTVSWPNAAKDVEYQLVAPAGFVGPATVYIQGGEVQ
jgi:hypothetical protein